MTTDLALGLDPAPYATQRAWSWIAVGANLAANRHDGFLAGEASRPRQPGPGTILTQAGLDWRAESATVFVGDPSKPSSLREVEGGKAVVRSDTGEPLGLVGEWHRPLDHLEFAGFARSLFERCGASLLAGGSVRGGKVIYLAADLPADRDLVPSVVVSASHDSSIPLRVDVAWRHLQRSTTITPIGAVLEPLTWTKRLTKSSLEAKGLDAAMEMVNGGLEASRETLGKWRRDQPTSSIRKRIDRTLFKSKGSGQRDHFTSLRESLDDHLEFGQGDDLAGSTLGLWVALCEWLEWLRPIRPDSRVPERDHRLLLTWFGSVANQRAKVGALFAG